MKNRKEITVLWLRELAALGAHARIAQLEAANAANLAEIELIRREFKLKNEPKPEPASQDAGEVLHELRKKHEYPAHANSSGVEEEKPHRKRRRKTPAQRKAISKRMKQYWVQQRG